MAPAGRSPFWATGLAIVGTTAAMLVSVTGAAGAAATEGGTGLPDAQLRLVPLWVSSARTPRIRNPNVQTTGVYPKVSLPGIDLAEVNAALRARIVESEQQFAAGLPRKRIPLARAFYGTSIQRPLLSASTVVVSALLPTVELVIAGGHGGSRWLSVTVRVATARPVEITELFARPSRHALNALAVAVRKRLIAENRCVRRSLFSDGLAPTVDHYKQFALLPNGLLIGFPLGQVGAPPCGRVTVVVPYSVVWPCLSELGRELVKGARWPRHR
jgi:hypothetical protein